MKKKANHKRSIYFWNKMSYLLLCMVFFSQFLDSLVAQFFTIKTLKRYGEREIEYIFAILKWWMLYHNVVFLRERLWKVYCFVSVLKK